MMPNEEAPEMDESQDETDFLSEDWRAWARSLVSKEPKTFTITSTNKMNSHHRYDLGIEDDLHWELVKLGASHKMDYETYAEQILRDHVKEIKEQD